MASFMRSLCLVFATITTLITGGVYPRSARAEERPRVAVLALDIRGDAAPELRQQVQAQIATGLARGGAKVVSLRAVRESLQGRPELIGCYSSACLERIGDLLSVHLFVRAVLTAGGAHYDLKLELLQSGGSAPLRNSVTTSCSVCTISVLNERTLEAASDLLTVDTEEFLPVVVASIPDGATISIDGLEAGRSPVETDLSPGSHRITAVYEGYRDAAKTIEVGPGSSGTQQRFELPMIKPLESARMRVRPARHYGYWKWGSAITAGASAALGTTLLLLDNKPACRSSPEQQCKFLYDTRLGAVVSLSIAAFSGAAAGWMFWSESKGGSREQLSIQIIPGGASAGMAFRF